MTITSSARFGTLQLTVASIALAIGLGCSASAGSNATTATGGGRGTGMTNGGGTTSTTDGGPSLSSDGGPQIVTASDAGQVQSTVIPADSYKVSCNGGCAGSSTCQTQTCTASENCVTTSQGSECATPCPGQLCSPASATPYCTRTGGVLCQ